MCLITNAVLFYLTKVLLIDSVNKISLDLLETAVNDKKTTIPCKSELGMEYTKAMADAPPPLAANDSIPKPGLLHNLE